jgi:DNA-binding NarL/FixJ family response regulator
MVSGMEKRPTRLLIVDDHELVREGLRLSLADDERFETVGVAATGHEAVVKGGKLRPDVAVVDYRLPDIAGDEVCRRLIQVSAHTRVVLLTSYVSADRVRAAVAAGAFGYVDKQADLATLRSVLDEAARAAPVQQCTSTPAMRYLLEVLEADSEREAALNLSAHQRRVLELAVAGRTDRQIGEALCVSESTVRYHLQRLKQRVGARSKVELVQRAYAAGLLQDFESGCSSDADRLLSVA